MTFCVQHRTILIWHIWYTNGLIIVSASLLLRINISYTLFVSSIPLWFFFVDLVLCLGYKLLIVARINWENMRFYLLFVSHFSFAFYLRWCEIKCSLWCVMTIARTHSHFNCCSILWSLLNALIFSSIICPRTYANLYENRSIPRAQRFFKPNLGTFRARTFILSHCKYFLFRISRNSSWHRSFRLYESFVTKNFLWEKESQFQSSHQNWIHLHYNSKNSIVVNRFVFTNYRF